MLVTWSLGYLSYHALRSYKHLSFLRSCLNSRDLAQLGRERRPRRLLEFELPVFPFHSAQNGSESRFRDKLCFFLVSTCVTYYGLFYCSFDLYAPLLEINCTIGVVLRQCFSILFEFQVIRKGCIFSPFLPFVLLSLRS